MRARDELLEEPEGRKPARQTFHFNKSVRREDLDVMRKRKKREWLRKMYASGLATELQAGALDAATREAAVARTLRGATMDTFKQHMRQAGGEGGRPLRYGRRSHGGGRRGGRETAGVDAGP